MGFRLGTEVTVVRSTSDPAVTNDTNSGYYVGQEWINTTTSNHFLCINSAAGAAVWRFSPRGWQGGNLALTGTTAETVMATVTLVANVIGATGRLESESTWSSTNSANNKSYRMRLGGISGTEYQSLTTANIASVKFRKEIQNLTAGTQNGGIVGNGTAGGYGAVTAAGVTSSIDTTAQTTLVFTGQLADSGETMTLLNYRVTLTRNDT
jgi:hypothetical protein